MNVRRTGCRLRWLVLFLGAALAFTGCGGGGGGESSSDDGPGSPPASKTVSGVVADGYLVGATVFSDQNGNKKWDEGEPKATTGAGGAYTLEGVDVDHYPVVVLVDVGVTDEDTNAPVTKRYVLTAPAGRPEFISPMTTLVQGQIESNPALSSDDAEAVVRQRIGAPDEVSLFDDYVSGAAASDEYASVHRVAQVVAATFGEMQEQVEAVAEAAGYSPEEVLDALVDIVARRVTEELSAIAVAVDQAGDASDPASVAETVMADINNDAPISSDSIGREIGQAQTPAAASSFQVLLQEEGDHWFWAHNDYDGYEVEYGVVTLSSGGDTLEETSFDYDFDTQTWGPSQNDPDYFLKDGQWVVGSDDADGFSVSFNPDGTVTAVDPVLGEEMIVSAASYDLAGKPMATFVDRVLGTFLADPAATFPSGAKAYRLTFEQLRDSYQLWGDEATPFETLVTDYAKGSGSYFYWSGLLLQFGADGTVDASLDRSGTPDWAGTWDDRTVQGQSIRVIHLPRTAILASEDDGEPILVEWADGSTWKGQFLAAGSIQGERDFDFNKAAFDAIMGNLDLSDSGSGAGGSPGGTGLRPADLVGTWSDQNDPMLGEGTWHLYGDGSYVIEFQSYTEDANGAAVDTPISISGTYSVSGDTLVLSPQSAVDPNGDPITDYDTCWFFGPYYTSMTISNVYLASSSPAELRAAPDWSVVPNPAQPTTCGNDGGGMDTSTDTLLVTRVSTTP